MTKYPELHNDDDPDGNHTPNNHRDEFDPFGKDGEMFAVEPTELYDLSLERVLETPTVLDGATRKCIRIQDFLGNGRLSGVARFIASHTDQNYTTVIATSLVQGISIFQHEHAEILSELNQLNNDTVVNTYEVYEALYEGYKPRVNYGNLTKTVWTDPETLDKISHHAATLNITTGQLATMCVCMSIATSTSVSERITKECKLKLEQFNISCNIVVENLKRIKY